MHTFAEHTKENDNLSYEKPSAKEKVNIAFTKIRQTLSHKTQNIRTRLKEAFKAKTSNLRNTLPFLRKKEFTQSLAFQEVTTQMKSAKKRVFKHLRKTLEELKAEEANETLTVPRGAPQYSSVKSNLSRLAFLANNFEETITQSLQQHIALADSPEETKKFFTTKNEELQKEFTNLFLVCAEQLESLLKFEMDFQKLTNIARNEMYASNTFNKEFFQQMNQDTFRLALDVTALTTTYIDSEDLYKMKVKNQNHLRVGLDSVVYETFNKPYSYYKKDVTQKPTTVNVYDTHNTPTYNDGHPIRGNQTVVH